MIGAEVSLPEVVWGDGVQLGGEHGEVRVLLHDPLRGRRGAEQVDKDDMILQQEKKEQSTIS